MRKRKYLIGLVVLVAALATAVVALAETTRTYSQKFSESKTGAQVTKPNSFTGTYFEEHSDDFSNTEGNEQSKLDKYVDVVFPKGSAIEQRTAPSCRKTNQEIFVGPPGTTTAVCPKKSVIGSGAATVRFPFPDSGDASGTITVINCYDKCKPADGSGVGKNKELILYVNVTGANPIILRGNIRGKQNETQKIHVPIPINCLLGKPPDCKNSNGVSNGDARISSLALSVKKITKKIKVKPSDNNKKKRAFLRTPKTCPPTNLWKFQIIFAGRDGVDQKYDSKVPCTPPSN